MAEYGELLSLADAKNVERLNPRARFLCFRNDFGLADRTVLDVNELGLARANIHQQTAAFRIRALNNPNPPAGEDLGQIQRVEASIANANPSDPRLPGWIEQLGRLRAELQWYLAIENFWSGRVVGHISVNDAYTVAPPVFPASA